MQDSKELLHRLPIYFTIPLLLGVFVVRDVQAAGGEQALALLANLPLPPRFILLDYAMPGMNGLQLAKAIHERGVQAPHAWNNQEVPGGRT